ncbi:MAG: superoxide dismutase family protein [Betaproteobacteria bacterium]|jgi:Cu-Zn family superoxide dismutase|uniref:Superoxide dismutase [Cu-Zn] n=1 Tax=Candidatus Proximibacter danicus TaxID=2954365 RepID=A0A9D7K0J6_9PROT|nr:superoxide dismutase family protein [Candidatus Proximibacter danicus]MBK9446874.1 superoxide dismutase family protein [Betaproteobacteria bacterium]
MTKFLKYSVLPIAAILAGCAGSGHGDRTAEAALKPTQGNAASGTVSFRQEGGGVQVTARVSGLTPGAHGFHIHDKGDCSAPDATSAGGHFNPTGKAHGHPDHADHHAGDMPQLMADAAGNATLSARLTGVGIGEGAGNIVGRGVIIHAAPDDFKTQPTGNSGARVACGVIAAR